MIPVCLITDVPVGEGRAVTLGDRRIAVFHAEDGWYALDHACPHKGGPLADGILAERCVACPLHERRYDLRTGAALGGGAPVVAYRTEVRDGVVVVAA